MADGSPTRSGDDNEEQQWQSLYRRYRPRRFAEVRGQDHVTLALRNAVRDDKVAHAYLFSGPRGTGKTSTARILAKALNCEDLQDGEPCGRCGSCVSITRGASFDVHELDAASNNGVESMRDLVARAALATPGRWKVYIVDEVHMLSPAASNALLKTLEEPPSHVVFVLATTDPQKVLPTIRSRTQHFEFHLLAPETLGSLLADIVSDADLELPDEAIDVAVRRGRGSARDALSVLDQVAASGLAEDEAPVVAELVTAIAERDTGLALAALAQGLADGREVHRIAVDLVEQLRRGFLLLAAPSTAARLDATLGAPDAPAEAVRELGLARCVRAMEVIGATQVDMRGAADPRITLEIALARLTHPEADDSGAALLERIERLERALQSREPAGGGSNGPIARRPPTEPRASLPAQPPPTDPPLPGAPPEGAAGGGPGERPALGAFQKPSGQPGPAVRASQPGQVADRPPAAAPSAAAGASPTRDEFVAAWGDHVLTSLRPKARAVFQAGRFVGVEGGAGLFAVPNDTHLTHAEPLRAEVTGALSRHFGREIEIRLVVEQLAGPLAGGQGGGGPLAGGQGGGADGGGARARAYEEDDAGDLDDPEEVLPREARRAEEPGVSWATDRLLQAFPGAEEV